MQVAPGTAGASAKLGRGRPDAVAVGGKCAVPQREPLGRPEEDTLCLMWLNCLNMGMGPTVNYLHSAVLELTQNNLVFF